MFSGSKAKLTPVCFFLLSVGYKTAWTAISSLLGQLRRDYGPHILLSLNVAYFFPSIPVLFLQSYITDALESKFGSQLATLARFGLGYSSLIVLTAGLPFWATTEQRLILVTVLIGMSYGISFGTSYQLVSKFPRENTVALTTGFVSCGGFVLAFDVMLKRGPYYTAAGLERLFALVSLQTAVGLAAACLLVTWHWRMLSTRKTVIEPLAARPTKHKLPLIPGSRHSFPGAAHSLRLRTDAYDRLPSSPVGNSSVPDSPDTSIDMSPMLGSATSGSSFNGVEDTLATRLLPQVRSSKGDGKGALPMLKLLRRIAPAAAALSASVGTSMLVFPFFTYVRSTGLMNEHLPQVLFYVRLLADIGGRVVPASMQARTVRRLLFWTLVKLALTPLLLLAIFQPRATAGDVGITVLVAAFWILSGYLNTCAYVIAPQLVPPVQASKVGGLMAAIFQSSCFGALMLAFLIQAVSVPQWTASAPGTTTTSPLLSPPLPVPAS